MKKIVFFFLIIFNCSAFAQNTQLSQNEIVSLYQKIEKATNAHQSFSCNFTQTKHNSILTQDAKLRGEIHLQQPDNIAIIGTFPLQYSIIIKNNTMTMTKNGKSETIDLDMKKRAEKIKNIIEGTTKGDFTEVEKIFHISCEKSNIQYILTLKSKSKNLAHYIDEIKIYFNTNDYSIDKLIISKNENDYIEYLLTNKNFNIDNTHIFN